MHQIVVTSEETRIITGDREILFATPVPGETLSILPEEKEFGLPGNKLSGYLAGDPEPLVVEVDVPIYRQRGFFDRITRLVMWVFFLALAVIAGGALYAVYKHKATKQMVKTGVKSVLETLVSFKK